MAKKKPAAVARTTALAAATDTPKPKVGIAAEFEVAGVKIPISAADLANIQKNGLQFALPEGADVTVQGSIQDFVKAVGKMLGVPDLPLPDPKDIPKPFDQLFGGQINIKITRLSLNTKSGQFAIAVGFVPVTPVKMPDPLGFIQLNSMSFAVDRPGSQS